MPWIWGKSFHFSEPVQSPHGSPRDLLNEFFSFVKWGERVRCLTSLSSPLGLLDVHQRWALVWLACLLLASVLFLLFLFKKDHVKGEHFPTPHAPGAGLGVPLEKVAAELMGCPGPSPLTGWLRLLKEDLRAGGECEQVTGGGPPPAGGPRPFSPLPSPSILSGSSRQGPRGSAPLLSGGLWLRALGGRLGVSAVPAAAAGGRGPLEPS